jgi:ATP-dependent exoDNAse (exonuclease V) beta subunit
VNLTRRQLEAVDVEADRGDTCIVAVPGSGKTTVLVEFYRRLVADKGVPPQRILAITFTEKAARHMKTKLTESCRELPECRRQLEQAQVSTIHGFCTRLLREYPVAAGIDPEFQVLDARRAAILQKQAANHALDRMIAEKAEAIRRMMRGLDITDLAEEIPGIYDGMRAAGVDASALHRFKMEGATALAEIRRVVNQLGNENAFHWKPTQVARLKEVLSVARRLAELPDSPVTLDHFQLMAEFPTNLKGIKQGTESHTWLMAIKDDLLPQARRALITSYYSAERETLMEAIHCFERIYTQSKRQIVTLDFADLQTLAVQLLESDTIIRRRVQAHFQYVLMDEFQDTNRLEARLVGLIRTPGRFYAVGDMNQSIYGFRHAQPDVFREYRAAVRARRQRLVELDENWRSRPEILHATAKISHQAQGIEPLPLVAKREFPLKAQASIEVLAALADTQDAALDLEARWVTRRILEFVGSLQLVKGTAHFGDIAVLLRNSEVAPAITQAFEQAGVPYLLNQGKGFFETREIVDASTLLHVIDNPRDEISLAAVLRSPFAGVSDEGLMRLKSGGNLSASLRALERLGAAFSVADLSKLRRFHERLLRWREAGDIGGLDRLIMRAMDETGYCFNPGTRAAANIEKFLALAREASSRLTLRQFVDEIDLMREADAREPDVPPEDAVNAVRIMTVHAAKGLEFPIVFLAALHKGTASGSGRLEFSPNLGIGAKWINPATGESKRDCFLKAIADEVERREADESSRLLYVAMTRAEEHLVFSYSSFGKAKEWAAVIEAALGLDLRTPQQRVQRTEAPDGESFSLRILATDQPPPAPVRSELECGPPPIPRLLRPEVRGQHDFGTNVTSVALFSHCPRRYYLERYLGWSSGARRNLKRFAADEPDDKSAASQFGLEVHAMLAGQEVTQPAQEARKLVDAFQASELGRRAARASRIEREFDFLMAVEDVVLRGQIDLWFEEAGELVLADYKTDDIKAREAASRARLYAPQLRLYALALERITGRTPAHAFVYYLRPGVAVPIMLERSLIDSPEALVRDFRNAQSTLDFPLREGAHCTRCPYYRGLCPAGSDASNKAPVTAVDGHYPAGDGAGDG